MTNFGKVDPGEPVFIEWKDRDLIMTCCDCGLVHRVHFVEIQGKLIIQMWREEKRTEKMRAKKRRPTKK
jgi:hypothetical protein